MIIVFILSFLSENSVEAVPETEQLQSPTEEEAGNPRTPLPIEESGENAYFSDR